MTAGMAQTTEMASNAHEVQANGPEPGKMTPKDTGNGDSEENQHAPSDPNSTDSASPNGTMVVDQAKYILQLEDRLRLLEKRLSKIEGDKDEPKAEAYNEEDYSPARINRVPPHQWRRIKRKPGLIPGAGTLLVSLPLSTGKHRRLAINSKFLLTFLSGLTKEPITATENVWVWPFKYIAVYEAQIRKAFTDAQQKCDELQAQLASAAGTASLPNDTEASTTAETSAREARMERCHLGCLVQFIDEDLQSIRHVRRCIDNLSLKTIAFDYLWFLFKPGDLVLSQPGRREVAMRQAFVVLHVTGGRTSFDPGNMRGASNTDRDWDSVSESEEQNGALARSGYQTTAFIIDCVFLDFDGIFIGPRSRRFVVPAYPGEQPILSLDVYPAKFEPDHDRIVEDLVKRGKRFLSCSKPEGAHQRYAGKTIRESYGKNYSTWNYLEINEEQLETEVVVDQAAAIEHFRRQHGPFRFQFNGRTCAAPTLADGGEVFDRLPDKSGGSWITDIHDDSSVDVGRRSDFVGQSDLLNMRRVDDASIGEVHLQLLPPRIYAYALLNRKWFPLKVALLTEVAQAGGPSRFPRTRFDDLVLPLGHKQMLQALIKHYTSKEEKKETKSMDLVYGKGGGLITLLHGPPGVGKTSTAECVAAELGRPLMPITCGDLGGQRYAESVEKSLEKFCNLASKWRCVLLLDEADVFLSKREKGDTDRNSYVAVFLRVLEYYSGVLILTSNRVGEIDEAFRSRIHVCLFYPKLDKMSIDKIWENNISWIRISDMNVDVHEDVRRFYERLWDKHEKQNVPYWNGRQIRNAFQTAIALAHWDFHEASESARLERPTLRAKHFRRISRFTAHFDDYISSIHGLESQDAYSVLAQREEVRIDSAPLAHDSRGTKTGSRLKRRLTRRDSALDSSSDSLDNEESDYGNESGSDGHDIKTLKLKLKLAKLQKEARKG